MLPRWSVWRHLSVVLCECIWAVYRIIAYYRALSIVFLPANRGKQLHNRRFSSKEQFHPLIPFDESYIATTVCRCWNTFFLFALFFNFFLLLWGYFLVCHPQQIVLCPASQYFPFMSFWQIFYNACVLIFVQFSLSFIMFLGICGHFLICLPCKTSYVHRCEFWFSNSSV